MTVTHVFFVYIHSITHLYDICSGIPCYGSPKSV